MTFCKDCGAELPYDGAEFCPHCGEAQHQESPPSEERVPKTRKGRKMLRKEVRIIQTVPHKSPGTAALIAFIGAIFGLPGIGHIYVGRVGRGILILISGFLLYIMSWVTLFGSLIGGGLAAASGAGIGFLQVGGAFAVVLAFMYVALLIWQIFNARSVAKQHNEQVQRIGIEDTDAA